MKLIHISDLHLGKVLHGVSMLENGDQPYWIDRFLELTTEQHPDAVLIAGDVYDRGSPSSAAVEQLSRLVEGLAAQGVCVLLTAGNHDSGQRLAFARELLARQNVHIAGNVERELIHVTLHDEYGPVTFWLMPYVFPAVVAKVLGDDTIHDYETAIRRLLAAQEFNPAERNVLIAHQNVTAFGSEVERGGSESAVGGVGQVDHSAFNDFDYVALGHVHASYYVGRYAVRYSGSPLCYHFKETKQKKKGPVLVQLDEKGKDARIEVLHIPPLHPMREMRGAADDLRCMELDNYACGEYLRLVLTDQPLTPELSDFFHRLAEQRGSILMEQITEYRQFTGDISTPDAEVLQEKSLEELFADFFTKSFGGKQPEAVDVELLQKAGELLCNSTIDSKNATTVDKALTDALLEYLMKQEDNA